VQDFKGKGEEDRALPKFLNQGEKNENSFLLGLETRMGGRRRIAEMGEKRKGAEAKPSLFARRITRKEGRKKKEEGRRKREIFQLMHGFVLVVAGEGKRFLDSLRLVRR